MTCVCHLHCNRKYINEQIIIRYNRCVEIMRDTGIYPNADHWQNWCFVSLVSAMCGSERERVCVWIIAVFCMRHTGNVG